MVLSATERSSVSKRPGLYWSMEHSVPYVWENSPGNDEVRIQDLSDQK